jgi:hypothetical protein
MNKLFCTTMTLAAALAAASAQAADDFYAGASLSGKGNLGFNTPTMRIAGSHNPLPLTLSGGYNVTDNLALEGGYTHFGNFKFGSVAEVDLSTVYVAAKGSVHVSDNWTLFGKVGMARTSSDLTVAAGGGEKVAKVRPMFGIGAGYRLTERLTLQLELAHYGRIETPKSRLTVRQLHAGVNYRF